MYITKWTIKNILNFKEAVGRETQYHTSHYLFLLCAEILGRQINKNMKSLNLYTIHFL